MRSAATLKEDTMLIYERKADASKGPVWTRVDEETVRRALTVKSFDAEKVERYLGLVQAGQVVKTGTASYRARAVQTEMAPAGCPL